MKRITFRADEDLIERARIAARTQGTTLAASFREWLAEFSRPSGTTTEVKALMERLRHVKAGRRSTRDEMNER
jgi:hypothetical protein